MLNKKASPKPFPARPDGTTAPLMRLVTVREACVYGRFSHTKAYDYIRDGRIDAYKRDGRTLISLDSVDRMHAGLTKIEPKTASAEISIT